MNWINKIVALFRREPRAEPTLGQELADFRKAVKQFNARRLKRMCTETGLDTRSLHKLAAVYRIPTVELVNYYCYFSALPDKDHLLIIQHFGVAVVIPEAETKLEEINLIED